MMMMIMMMIVVIIIDMVVSVRHHPEATIWFENWGVMGPGLKTGVG